MEGVRTMLGFEVVVGPIVFFDGVPFGLTVEGSGEKVGATGWGDTVGTAGTVGCGMKFGGRIVPSGLLVDSSSGRGDMVGTGGTLGCGMKFGAAVVDPSSLNVEGSAG